ncbi:hypothetical protein D917_10376 [Trichinella nativa]|uniref:Uncharacterized protein n=1 Tax=Trichinella nativa TaxID=6335 RepID=A0A1Y3EB30_9BILA|nr:hypothetical protein D917_10376 [Trichinella nativa]
MRAGSSTSSLETCLVTAVEAERPQLSETTLSTHTTIRSQRVDLSPETLPLGNPHPDLLRCFQLPSHQGSALTISSGGAAVLTKHKQKALIWNSLSMSLYLPNNSMFQNFPQGDVVGVFAFHQEDPGF